MAKKGPLGTSVNYWDQNIKQDQNNYLGKRDFPLVKDWEKLGF